MPGAGTNRGGRSQSGDRRWPAVTVLKVGGTSMPKYQRNNGETMPSGMSRSAGVAGPNRLENPKVGRGIALRGGMVPARNRGDADVQTQVPGQIAQLRLGGAHPDHPVVPGHLGA